MKPDTSELDIFEHHRARLFGIAYRMLGSVADAEDVLQDAYLRWHKAEAISILAPEAWLVSITTRLSIDRLRQASAERERYVGNWLPEPMVTEGQTATDRHAEIASDLSMAFLVLLERLAPEERAALLLRDVFDTEYAEIARVLDKSEVASRQMVSRARQRIRTEHPRFPVPMDTKERLLVRFLAALAADDQDAVLSLVSADATLVADSGGKVSAARNVLAGADRIARFLIGIERKGAGRFRNVVTSINGEPAFLTYVDGRLLCTTSVETDGERLVAFYRMMNPEKLGGVNRRTLDGAEPATPLEPR